MSYMEVKYALRAKYSGGSEKDWIVDTVEEANKKWKFLTERANTEWVELYEMTMTIDMQKVERFERKEQQ